MRAHQRADSPANLARRRRKHEERINNEANPLIKLHLTWMWIFAEARRQPHRLQEITDQIHQIGVDLTNRKE